MSKQFIQIGRSVLAITLLIVMSVSAFTANTSTVSTYLVPGGEDECEFNITLNSTEISNEARSSSGYIPIDPYSKSSIPPVNLSIFLRCTRLGYLTTAEYRLGANKLSSTPPLYILFHSLKVDTTFTYM